MGHLYYGELLVITSLGIPHEAEKVQLVSTPPLQDVSRSILLHVSGRLSLS